MKKIQTIYKTLKFMFIDLEIPYRSHFLTFPPFLQKEVCLFLLKADPATKVLSSLFSLSPLVGAMFYQTHGNSQSITFSFFSHSSCFLTLSFFSLLFLLKYSQTSVFLAFSVHPPLFSSLALSFDFYA